MAHAVKTGKWGGVVTAFITMSDIKDEIDWEFPGAQTTEGQSNYFWQGVVRTYIRLIVFLKCSIALQLHRLLVVFTATSLTPSSTTTTIPYVPPCTPS